MMVTSFFFKKLWTSLAAVSHFGYLSKGVCGSYYCGEGKMDVILEGMRLGRSLDHACLLYKL